MSTTPPAEPTGALTSSASRPGSRGRRRVVLGVGGGIAAYKAALLLRLFSESGDDVTVVPTAAALNFVGAPTWEALSGKPVSDRVWDRVEEVPHVRIGKDADLVVVAPATADLLARAAHGFADDLLTNVLLTARCPVVFAPAMHTEMWEHPATRANVATLRERGMHVVEPASGRLTGADTGPGRLPEPEVIHAACLRILEDGADAAGPAGQDSTVSPDAPARTPAHDSALAGLRVVVSAGGTREPLDPVRYLGNRSSGKQGYALAAEALHRGAHVTLVTTASLPDPVGADVVRVETARELQDAMTAAAAEADVVVMAAAVADFRPAEYVGTKIKKTQAAPGEEEPDDAPVVRLVRNPDVLAGLVHHRDELRTRTGDPDAGPLVVGFAAETGDETGDVLHHARAKLARKGSDLLVANEVGVGVTFGQDDTTVHVLAPGGRVLLTAGPTTKAAASAAVWDAVEEALRG
ncbi:bifunctional phosphopantothenoylcysteine decarboxylase/phosphopantothenate synthase [Mobilicoccus pelagius]|uniref:Coenzyme A biosynthesis bifunctional protein CoaBC n=1 Tax=Mobilicoccus pelagius NBRC 104925 TaxID=1089455 RepID=H5UV06_9MICO|nr:bifunctional phosphopantothenoylcysteine decarboxylase/phosphopantothenate synthase [Mobilicoccus pelagius]GAB49564.1 coenzyme A biosynthesis bifunctional protein CoaBC [Mobilicoccus pelagius NBRC 104925]